MNNRQLMTTTTMNERSSYLHALVEEYVAAGRFVEAGLIGVCIRVGETNDMPPDAEMDAMRSFFFAGAQCVLANVKTANTLDEDGRSAKLDLIEHEIAEFLQTQYLAHSTSGHA